MPRERISHACYLKTLFCERQHKEKAFAVVAVAEHLKEKQMTDSASADTSMNCCNLAVVCWNIPLE